MPRAYLRLDPRFAERKASYPDGAFRALVEVLCLAEFQPERGRFRSQKMLKALLESRGRWLGWLMEHGDIEVKPDRILYVVGWDEWQEGDVTVKERQRRIRARRGNGPKRDPSNGLSNGPDRIHPAIDRFSYSKESGGISGSVQPLRRPARPPLSDDEEREHLDRLGESMSANGIPMPGSASQRTSVTDEELVARYRGIADDESEPDWKREAARAQLGLMGIQT